MRRGVGQIKCLCSDALSSNQFGWLQASQIIKGRIGMVEFLCAKAATG